MRSTTIQWVTVLAIGIALLYLAFRNIPIESLQQTLQNGNYKMLLPVYLVSILGYWFRSKRWQLLTNAMDANATVSVLFGSLSMGYAVNIVTPRLGEITRCALLSKYGSMPIERSVLSVVVERIVDVLSLLILLLVSAFFVSTSVDDFIQRYIINAFAERLKQIKLSPWFPLLLITALTVFGLLLYWFYKRLPQLAKRIQSLSGAAKQLIEMKQKTLFAIYTVLIWVCYYLMTYLWFSVFTETATLGLSHAFVLMVIGSLGRSVPIQGGGMGAYHFLVSQLLLVFGVSITTGTALAFVIHGAQLLLTFVLGLVSWLGLVRLSSRT
ncbi:MAG: flippase-like domain-containing protein [Bacteroidia bacterium]|jgi:hypothetical protein|nr:flippase-like domain-containing protein [Bacteroidia bacterium]